MKFKKLIAFLCAVVTMFSAYATPVMAGHRTEDFYVRINGGAVLSSYPAEKLSPLYYMYVNITKKPGSTINWLNTETVLVRGRTHSGARCTALGSRKTPGECNLVYSSGHGQMYAEYKLAVQYDDGNPWTHLELRCTWRP